MLSIPRLLPVTILAALLLLTVKLGGIWDGVSRIQAGIGTVPVQAQQQAQQQAPANQPPADSQQQPGGQAGAQSGAQQGDAAGKGTGGTAVDPILFSRSEIELLQELSRRRDELDQREQTLVQKEGLLAAAEQRIDKKIAELDTIRSDIEALIKKYNEQEEAEVQRLVKIYEAMKPKDAARIFDQLDMNILLQVVERMAERRVAPILADMSPKRANELTAEIATRRQMPNLGTQPTQ
ncbi:MotE family protein [Oceanibaculum nanhaiense]|uniref:MotE family protein n=1 Tax=Oceanibaculum nanhaiense TaxID=1909734 RepID=UPI00396D2694